MAPDPQDQAALDRVRLGLAIEEPADGVTGS
jgi:hypothetical protein